MESSRFGNSVKNLLSGFASRFMMIILGMVVRTVFVKTLGSAYLGVNGLYSNILSMLSLAELGFGTAMVYSMYKPLAVHDQDKLASLMCLYKKVYRVIGWIILGLGLCIVPFLSYIIKNPPAVGHLTLYYVLFLVNTVLSYWFFSYKRSILTADQKEYISTNYRNIFNVGRSAAQIIILVVFRNFLLYLLTQLVTTVLENIAVAHKADQLYPALNIKSPLPLEAEEMHKIKQDVKGLMLTKIGHVILNSTDNIIISAFVGIEWVGLLSNFTLIIEAVTGVLCQITAALSASLGNYFVEKSKEDGYLLFERVEFLNSWLYGFSALCLVTLLNPFVELWLGKDYTLSEAIVVALSINFFVQGYMNTIWTFRSTLGLFIQGWFRPIIVSILNIIFSILLGIKMGTFGVLIATFISRAMVNIWYDPLIIHKYGFEKSVKPFYLMYIRRVLEILFIGACITGLKLLILKNGVNILSFILLMFATVLVFAGLFLAINFKRDEYRYFMTILEEKVLVRIRRK